jgi:uncharacterized protein (TIGR00369 family)
VRFIGAEVEEGGEGHARLRLATGPQHADRAGRVHGGVLTALLDTACAIALWNARGESALRRPHASIEMSASFLGQAAPGDELAVEGRILRLTERLAFGESEARRHSDETLIARARVTFAISGHGR